MRTIYSRLVVSGILLATLLAICELGPRPTAEDIAARFGTPAAHP